MVALTQLSNSGSVSYDAEIISYDCVFSIRKENISPGEKWRRNDIYQIAVPKNRFASTRSKTAHFYTSSSILWEPSQTL